jgi:hypothetical protein
LCLFQQPLKPRPFNKRFSNNFYGVIMKIRWECGCASFPADEASAGWLRQRGCPNHKGVKEVKSSAAHISSQAGSAPTTTTKKRRTKRKKRSRRNLAAEAQPKEQQP